MICHDLSTVRLTCAAHFGIMQGPLERIHHDLDKIITRSSLQDLDQEIHTTCPQESRKILIGPANAMQRILRDLWTRTDDTVHVQLPATNVLISIATCSIWMIDEVTAVPKDSV